MTVGRVRVDPEFTRPEEESVSRRQSRVAPLALAAVAAAVLPALASAQAASPPVASPQGPWGSVSNVSRSGSPSDDPRLAAMPTGAVMYAWEGWDGRHWQIRVRTRGPRGGFTPPITLSPAGANHEDPRIAIGADGLTAVAWKNMRRVNRTVQVRVRQPGAARFGPTRTISNAHGDATQNRIAVLPNGDVLVVWAQGQGGVRVIQSRVLKRGATSFGRTVNVSRAPVVDSEAEGDPAIGVAGDGSVTVAWEVATRDGSFLIQVRRRSASGSWGPVQTISTRGAQSNDVQVAASPTGEVVVIWARERNAASLTSGGSGQIQARIQAPGSTGWGPITNLSRRGTHASDPQVGIAPDGTITAVWEWASDALAAKKQAQSRTRAAGGAWGPLQVLSQRGKDVDDPVVVVATDGTATAAWKRSYGRAGVRVQSRTRPAGATAWNGGVWLSGARGEADEPRLAVAPNGVVTAVWKLSSPLRVVPDQNFYLQTRSTRFPG